VAYEPAVRNATRSSFPTFFRGTDFVVAGVLPNGTSQFKALFSGIARGTPLTWQSTFELLPTTGAAPDVERVWAFLTIKELTVNRIVELSGMSSASLNDTVRRATELSLGYGFVTEFTSLIVVAEDADVAKNMTNANVTQMGNDGGADPISVAVAGGGNGGGNGFRAPSTAQQSASSASATAVSAAVMFICALAALN
jgi:hypothetical protein